MQATIPYTAADHVLLAKANESINKLYKRRQLVRLVGVRSSHFVTGNYQITFFDDTKETVSLIRQLIV